MAITRTAKGTASSKTSGTTLTLASVAMTTGHLLVVALAFDDATLSSVTWGGQTLTLGDTVLGAGVRTRIAYGNIVSGGTQTITATWASAIVAKALTATSFNGSVSGAVANADSNATNTGTGTAASTAATAAIVGGTESILFAAVGTEGPSGDTAGTAVTPSTAGQRVGTTGNPANGNVTVADAYQLAPSAGSTPALSRTGMTSRDWGAVIRAFYWAIPSQTLTVPLLDSSRALYAPTLANRQPITLPLLQQTSTQTVLSDTFTGLDTTQLTSHTPDIGGPWLQVGSAGIAEITSNAATPGVSAGPAYQAVTDVGAEDGTFTAVLGGSIGSTVELYIRTDATLTNGWRFVRAGDGWTSYHWNGANWITDDSGTGLGSGDKTVELTASGSSVVCRIDGVLTTQSTGLTLAGTTYVGISVAKSFGNGTIDNLTVVAGGAGAPALYAPTLAQVGGTSGQTVTAPLLDASPALYAPTLTPKNLLSLGLLDATAALYSPTLAPKNLLSLSLLDGGPALYSPTLAPKSLLSLGLLDSSSSLYAPTLTFNNLVSLGLLDSVADLFAPTLSGTGGGPSSIDLGLLDSSAALFAPGLAAKNTFVLGLLDASAALYAPTLDPKSTLALSLLDGAPVLYAPALLSKNAIALALLDAGPALYQPTLVGKNTISVGLLDGAPALYAPTVIVNQFVTLGLLDSAAALYAPVLNQGQSVVLGLLDGAPALFAPTLIQDQFVTLGLLDGSPALFAPTLIQDKFVTLGLLDGAPSLFAPALSTRNSIALGLLDGSPALYAPVLAGGPSVVTLALLDAGSALYAPILSQPITGVAGDVLNLFPGSRWRERYPWYHRGFPGRR